ncbi:MAG: radical SAM protein [Bacteroidales bacterium]|nr:radical SAM protein [Bacteroidales bacterium]
MKSLCGLTASEISELAECDERHALAIANWLYKRKSDDLMLVKGLSRKAKEKLMETSCPGIYDPVSSLRSADGTVKFLFSNEDGKEFETVLMSNPKRTTVCVSSQSGCRMGCPFCATGHYGFRGDLSVRDILNQVLGPGIDGKVTHVVFMGMGEPMDNLDNVLKACDIMTAEWGMAISPRNITVSTVGITPGVRKFLDSCECNLALSLFSPFPEERLKSVPAEGKYPAREILEVMKSARTGKKRRMSVAYIMIRDMNDTRGHLEGLKELLRDTGIRVNLLPYHSVPGDGNVSSPMETMNHFKHELVISGISASIRKSAGADIFAACGLLASGLK